ncbi:Glu-tRNA(Gln) amidotransferase GatDE subunit D [Candidatus Bathyarchaeota archaeon B24-2]|nr:MAG: Glu-tRNA(Gln) amidotransferase GatDE subunit D [Candidatus Bathyarchaeota archaeon B24-2]
MSLEKSGYRGFLLTVLNEAGVDIGDVIRVENPNYTYEGTLIPRSEFGSEDCIVIKLRSGYNIGVKVTRQTKITKLRSGEKPAFIPPPQPEAKPGLRRVAVISTGGTIASRVDYRTGGVRPALSASDLYSVVPELSDLAVIEADILFSILSENMTPQHWKKIAVATAKKIEEGVAGVVIPHGTDTMAYTAAALSFAFKNLPVPVILVGSQRSSDRPSSDAATNLLGAVKAAAYAPFAEVAVAMHESTSDDSILIHRGTKVRKCHTSARYAFKSINSPPLARVKNGKVTMLIEDYRRRSPRESFEVYPEFEDRVALLKFYPGLNPEVIDFYVDKGYLGLILEGTGLGHVSARCFPSVKRAIESGLIVAMTSQCIWGRVNMNVYDTGRDLLRLGVIPLEDMLPETALVKLMWVLGQTRDPKEAKQLLLQNMAYEFSDRTLMED